MEDIGIRTAFPRKIKEIENIWIPMPDGVKLASRIWLPEDANADPVPAILEYLPYRKRDGTVERDHLTHPYFAGHGYAGVRVDMRGTGDSEGVCLGEYLAQEQDDALAVIEWLSAQPWCSGKVGMIGISWGGFNGLQVAALQPEALGAVISLSSTDDRYADDIHFMGGAVLGDKLDWGATAFAIANTPPDPAIVGDRWRDMWIDRLEHNGLWMMDWFHHQRRDDFYRHGSICENYSAVKIPVYAVGGWADGYTNPIFRMMDNLPGPRKALIGPWAHKYPHFANPGPRIGFLQECLRWWDQHLKGIDTGIMDEPMVRAWVQDPSAPDVHPMQHPGRWVGETHWSQTKRPARILHVSAQGLSDTPSQAEIAISAPETAGSTGPAWCRYGVVPDGALDQRGEVGSMPFFDTEPLDSDMDLLGFPILEAQVTSKAAQANLAATLSAVDPDGTATLITFGVLNLTHRDSHTNLSAMPPGQAQPVRVQLNACGQSVAKGQRLRLSLATAYWPLIWPSQTKAELTLSDVRLRLPVRAPHAQDATLAPFAPPEGAPPLQVERQSDAAFHRRRIIDYTSGVETLDYLNDTGAITHLHTGLTVQNINTKSQSIHPDDPNSAHATSHWIKRYTRGSWTAEVDAKVSVSARADHWQVRATLVARDADGVVLERHWDKDIPRDLV